HGSQAFTALPGDTTDVPPVNAEVFLGCWQSPVAFRADLHLGGMLHHLKVPAQIAITKRTQAHHSVTVPPAGSLHPRAARRRWHSPGGGARPSTPTDG